MMLQGEKRRLRALVEWLANERDFCAKYAKETFYDSERPFWRGNAAGYGRALEKIESLWGIRLKSPDSSHK